MSERRKRLLGFRMQLSGGADGAGQEAVGRIENCKGSPARRIVLNEGRTDDSRPIKPTLGGQGGNDDRGVEGPDGLYPTAIAARHACAAHRISPAWEASPVASPTNGR